MGIYTWMFFTEERTDGFVTLVLGMCLVTKNTVVSKLKG